MTKTDARQGWQWDLTLFLNPDQMGYNGRKNACTGCVSPMCVAKMQRVKCLLFNPLNRGQKDW